MKKVISTMLAAALIMASFSGCDGSGNASETSATSAQNTDAAETSADTSVSTEVASDDSTTTSITQSEAASTTQTAADDNAASQQSEIAVGMSFSHESGIYAEAFELTISGDGEIYYTTDGADPTTSATAKQYTSPITIADRSNDKNYVSAVPTALYDAANVDTDKTEGFVTYSENPSDDAVDKCTVVRAARKNADSSYTKIITSTYFIGTAEEHIEGIRESCEAAGTSLAVLSLSVDYDDLFNSATGIYVKGDLYAQAVADLLASKERYDPDTSRRIAANFNQRGREWERNAHVDFFEYSADEVKLALAQDCGIRVQGNYSRSDLIKGFRLYARSDYGENNFNYAVFGEDFKNDSGDTMDKFKTLTLRAGGNCAFLAKYNDVYWQTLAEELDCETQKSRPCVVYLDGEYWGLYVLQEDYSDDYFEDTHGVNKDDVVLYKADAEKYEIGYKLDLGELPDGVSDVSYYYSDLKSFFKTHKSLASEEDYAEFEKLVDVDSALDYFSVQLWMNNKWDWPGKNWSMWRTINADSGNEYADNRWRFCFYDMEFGGISGEGDARTNTVKEDNYKTYGMLDRDTNNPAVLCFLYLMTNDGARASFEEKLLGLSNGAIEKQHALSVLETFKNTYSPLYDQFFARYPGAGETEDAVYGGYGSYQCIFDFVSKREKYIQKMVDYIEKTVPLIIGKN